MVAALLLAVCMVLVVALGVAMGVLYTSEEYRVQCYAAVAAGGIVAASVVTFALFLIVG